MATEVHKLWKTTQGVPEKSCCGKQNQPFYQLCRFVRSSYMSVVSTNWVTYSSRTPVKPSFVTFINFEHTAEMTWEHVTAYIDRHCVPKCAVDDYGLRSFQYVDQVIGMRKKNLHGFLSLQG
jgi:hypothetical protein